jgi:SAM-dependent methyltransferase
MATTTFTQPQAARVLDGGIDADAICPNCGGRGMSPFFAVDDIPVHSTLLLDTAAEAHAYPRGYLRLGFCPACGFIANTLFNPRVHEYSPRCEESQAFSPTFNTFARSLAQRWVERYGVRNRTIVEIGCGKGDFLMLICEAGDNQGIGIDPSSQPQRIPSEFCDRVRFIQELYGEQHANLPADAVLCRHTLEHIAPTGEFLRTIRRVIGDRKEVVVLFELPDVTRVLREGAFWDIYYEHCSYFTLGSLARLFRASGFDIVELERDYGDQYSIIAARPADGPTQPRMPAEDDLAQTARDVEHFRGAVARQLAKWRGEVLDRVQRGQRVVLWGALSKAVSFLTTLGLGSAIKYVVDINTYRQGKYMPGASPLIVPPKFLVEYRPDLVIAMNPIYRDEIRRDLDAMGVGAELVAV